MITDEIVEAMDVLIEACDSREQAFGMEIMRDMLCEFDTNRWNTMTAEEHVIWLTGFLEDYRRRRSIKTGLRIY